MELVIHRDGAAHEVRLVHRPMGASALESVAGALGVAPQSLVGSFHPGGEVTVLAAEPPTGTAPTMESADGGERRSFNRPPRAEFPIPLPPLSAPATLDEIRATARFGWGALVVPLVLGLIMAAVFHPRMAMFALFSPAMMLANWVEDRRRVRRERRAASHDLNGALATFRRRLMRSAEAETRLRRRAFPAPEVLVTRVFECDTRLWERRPSHDDAMRLGVGTACVAWQPAVSVPAGGMAAEAAETVHRLGVLHDVPVPISLRPGEVVGITGHPGRAIELARSLLVQAVTLHGPADLAVAVVTDRPDPWDWVKWLPHTVVDADAGRRNLAATPDETAMVLASLLAPPVADPGGAENGQALLMVDVADVSLSQYAPVRDLMARAAAHRLAAVAVAPAVTSLPSVCSSIVEMEGGGKATLVVPSQGSAVAGIDAWRLPAVTARSAARGLARLDDPDLRRRAAGLPDRVRLLDLLGAGEVTADVVIARWGRSDPVRPAAPIAVTAEGPLEIDLVTDGPHALLAGTTGSGKSELLRSFVAGLAASASPEHLTFVLVDYKGGSAFDACADLPHTVGLVTDLDGHLAQRALACLEAELRHRETRLREVGASDLSELLATVPRVPLPRLLVVVDEFAALAKELPEFMASLVDIAQRGRSLGVHLLLATQRPNGVVNDNIRANTNLRIALRVQDAADSVDVLGTKDAAAVARSQPGRGFVRRGPGDILGFQTALVTGPAGRVRAPALVPFVFAAEQPSAPDSSSATAAATDLELLVQATRAAAARLDIAPARRPWPEPLPAVMDADEASRWLATPAEGSCAFAVADEPARQRHTAMEWRPADGNLLLYGVAGSGTTTALTTIALAVARDHGPNEVHLYALDFDDQRLSALEGLPHVGAVVGAGDRERQLRTLRMVQDQITERRRLVAEDAASAADLPAVVLIVDNYAGFSAAYDDPADLGVKAMLTRIASDGPGVGVVTVATAKQPVDVPMQVSSLIPGKLLFRLADRYDYTGFGVSGVDVPTVPGRGFEASSGREFQVVRPHPAGFAAAVRQIDGPAAVAGPPPVGTLPTEVKIPDIVDAARIFDLEWFVPIGVGDSALAPAGFTLGDGDHVLVAGPARAGKSTTLTTIAEVVAAHRPDLTLVAVTPRRSPLAESAAVHHTVDDAAGLADLTLHGGALVLVDDATFVDDPAGTLAALVDDRRPGIHVVAAGEADLVRSAYGHWTSKVRRARLGLALRPNPAADGDLWQTTLPRRGPDTWPPGRGYLVSGGRVELTQVAWR